MDFWPPSSANRCQASPASWSLSKTVSAFIDLLGSIGRRTKVERPSHRHGSLGTRLFSGSLVKLRGKSVGRSDTLALATCHGGARNLPSSQGSDWMNALNASTTVFRKCAR